MPERSLDFLDFTVDSSCLAKFNLVSIIQFLLSEEDPVEEFCSNLNIVLELALCLLIPGNRVHIEDEFLTLTAEDSDKFLAFLHSNDCPVLENYFNCLI